VNQNVGIPSEKILKLMFPNSNSEVEKKEKSCNLTESFPDNAFSSELKIDSLDNPIGFPLMSLW
jgi:hypothetical protein